LYSHVQDNLNIHPALVNCLGAEDLSAYTHAFHHNFRITDIACFLHENYIWDDCSNALLEVAHFKHWSCTEVEPYLNWFFFSTMVLHALRADLKHGKFCATITNLRSRVAAPHFEGIAFVFFVNQHCTSYVYHAHTGILRYTDGLGGYLLEMPSHSSKASCTISHSPSPQSVRMLG